jgi:serine/threonine-protein kinase
MTCVLSLSEGEIIAGKYRVDGVIGDGGMGVVIAATHVELEQRVAIKALREVGSEALARFRREGRLVVQLKSPHVARVFDVGELDDGTPYLVMERLEGEDLRLMLRRGPLSVGDAVDVVLEAMEGIAEAHGLGIVHRDLKPANLFLHRGPGGIPSVKVLDFGISKRLDDLDVTTDGTALGSIGYMAPEQMTDSRSVDARADVWALGVILYQLLSGRLPHEAPSLPSMMVKVTEPIVPITELVPEVPEEVDRIIGRCLEVEPSARFGNVAQLAEALAPLASDRGRQCARNIGAVLGETVRQPMPAPAETSTVIAPILEAASPTTRSSRERRLPWVVGVLVILLASGSLVLTWALTTEREHAEPASTPEATAPSAPPPEVASTPETPASADAPPPGTASPPPAHHVTIRTPPRKARPAVSPAVPALPNATDIPPSRR